MVTLAGSLLLMTRLAVAADETGRANARASAAEPERSGLTFGVGLGFGKIIDAGFGTAASMRVGWALTPELAFLFDYNAILPSTASGGTALELRSRELFRGCLQYWPLSRLFLRGGLGAARPSDTTHDELLSAAYGVGLGYEAARGRHAVFDMSIEHGGWLWRDQLQSDVFVLLGFSYY